MSLELSYEEEDYGLDNGPIVVRLPVAKLREQGQQLVLMMVYTKVIPKMEYGKQNVPAINFKGEPATQDLITGYVMPQSTCVMAMPKRGDAPAQEIPAAPGTLVQLYVAGHNRFDPERTDSFMDVTRAFRETGERLEVGDVILACLSNITLEGRDGVALRAPKHVVSFAIRKSRPEERDMVNAARAKFKELRATDRAIAASAPAPQPQSAPAFSPVPANWGAAPAVAPAPAPAPAPTPWPSTPPTPAPAPPPAAPVDTRHW